MFGTIRNMKACNRQPTQEGNQIMLYFSYSLFDGFCLNHKNERRVGIPSWQDRERCYKWLSLL